MNDSLIGTSEAESKYRILLNVSTAISAQPNLGAVLHSLRKLLSAVVAFNSVSLLLLEESSNSVRLVAYDHGPGIPELRIGVEAQLDGTAVGRAIDTRKPVEIPDLRAELEHLPQFGIQPQPPARGYAFPLSTSRRNLGAIVFTKFGDFSIDDVELMTSVSSHVAVALDSAVASDEATNYLRQIADDRDRFRLLLEINNHVVSKLDKYDLFRAASASIRTYFGNDFAGFWLLDRNDRKLECAVLDVPTGKGFSYLADVPISDLNDEDFEALRARRPQLWSINEIDKLPAVIVSTLKAEAITSLAVTPLVTHNGPLGVMAMGCKRSNAFGQEDLDLLSQISSQIALAVDNAIAYGGLTESKNRIEEERLYLETEIRSHFNFEDIVGNSRALRKALDQIAIVAPTNSTVLLHGETGTGKELVARAIHANSQRSARTFVRLNCAAIPSGLIESELFGHERGAFTGALMQKRGRFELADHGTLFLDEIGDISMELQPKLLRALQEQEFERLGSTKTIHVDVRLIAATHRDLPTMIRNNQFREDLFYRLNVFPVEIPPLRERREDIPLLVHFFVSRLASRMQKKIKSIPKKSMEAIATAPWPGNIRELENFIERCVILSQGEELNVPLSEIKQSAERVMVAGSTFHEAERQTIINALKSASGKIAGSGGAAERLGLKRTTLQNKMRRLHITKSDYLDASITTRR